jgi:hypothetical protein
MSNCFLSSEFVQNLFGPNPTTERGASSNVNAHPKENKIIYPSGKYIVVRNLDNPAASFIYRGHAHPTTVAKFSPNGFWVASGDISGKVRSYLILKSFNKSSGAGLVMGQSRTYSEK